MNIDLFKASQASLSVDKKYFRMFTDLQNEAKVLHNQPNRKKLQKKLPTFVTCSSHGTCLNTSSPKQLFLTLSWLQDPSLCAMYHPCIKYSLLWLYTTSSNAFKIYCLGSKPYWSMSSVTGPLNFSLRQKQLPSCMCIQVVELALLLT